jgi:hypothetical protein
VPAPDTNETDTFTYTVTDGQGGTAEGVVTAQVTEGGDDPTPNQVALEVTRDPLTGAVTRVTLTFVGIAGRSYALERTGNLTAPVAWQCLETQVAGTTGLLEFIDATPLVGEAYYRTVERMAPCPGP